MKLIESLLAACAAAFLSSWYILGEINAIVAISVIVSGFAANQLIMSNAMPRGHGVNGSKHVLGMPLSTFVIYLILLIIIIMLMIPDSTFLPETNANFRAFGLAALWGWVAGLIEWYTSSARLTYYLSEALERSVLKARGCSQAFIDDYIADLRNKGLLPPFKKK